MSGMDRKHAEQVLARLESVTQDAQPLWGRMTAPQLFGHLTDSLRYTMGEGPSMPFRGNWVSRTLLRPLIAGGWVAMPKNVKLPRLEGQKTRPPMREGTLDELRTVMDAYLDGFASGSLPPRMHPFFGLLPAATWNRLHVQHFKHHLKQFGV